MNSLRATDIDAETSELDLVKEMALTPAFSRIRKVSFLGAVDLFNSMYSRQNTWGFTRSDHTMGVVSLTFRLNELIQPSHQDRKYLLAAAVCHDLGHSPYSHSTEKVYRAINPDLDHKKALEHVINSHKLGLSEILDAHGIDKARLVTIIIGHDEHLSWVFHNPLNVDTIDGVYRFLLSFRLPPPFSPARLVNCLASLFLEDRNLTPEEISECDNFWRVKSAFYGILLDTGRYADFENAYMNYLKENKDTVDVYDYLKDDEELFEEFDLSLMLDLWPSYVTTEYSSKSDKFIIDNSVEVRTIGDLYRRYRRHGGKYY